MTFPCVTKVKKVMNVMKVMRILGQFDGACHRPMDAIFVNALISNVCTYVVFPMAVSHCVIQVKFK